MVIMVVYEQKIFVLEQKILTELGKDLIDNHYKTSFGTVKSCMHFRQGEFGMYHLIC